MLEKIIKYQNEAEKKFESKKTLGSVLNYGLAIVLFFMSTLWAAFTLPVRYIFKKIVPKKKHTGSITVNDKNIESVLRSEKTILIDFWAEWCGPCVMMSGIIEKFAMEPNGICVAKVNADSNQKLIKQYNIKGLPQFVLIQNGKEIKRHAGSMTLSDLNKFCQE